MKDVLWCCFNRQFLDNICHHHSFLNLQTLCGSSRRTAPRFEPGGEMIQMNIPTMAHASDVVPPVLSFAHARLVEMETCTIICRAQFKDDGNGTGRKRFPRIAQAMGGSISRIWPFSTMSGAHS